MTNIRHFSDIASLLKEWEVYKHDDILTYRDHSYVSKYTKLATPVHPVPFMTCFDDSLEGYLSACKE